ncbi:phosphoenolpyruvate--protein phosphotransferase [Nocardioides aequoreus]|uniref:phosphoenolpyruvate--protein phosphotransferase n=1 Tax=Nocardioides aequoreus TaxID=397278 RepID=UPI0004C3A8C0|nr:putative PEP-binding protein [Nocardioides aequoreus]
MVTSSPESTTASAAEAVLRGTPVVAGVVCAPVVVVRTDLDPAVVAAHRESGPVDVDEALAAYDEAVAAVADGFERRAEQASDAAAEVLGASAKLARDKGLRTMVRKNLSSGAGLLDALDDAVEHFASLFSTMGGLMAERVTDLRDIGRRTTARLVGLPEPGVPRPEVVSVLVADDLAPADSAGLDASRVAALVMERGGATSHTAIIARQLGIPCLVGVTGALALEAGAVVLVDAAAGTVETEVDEADAERRVATYRREREELESWTGPAQTADGIAVKLLANVADGASAASAADGPIEGVGLFRTELAFLGLPQEPTVEEQAELYEAVLSPFGTESDTGRYVVTRTLDAGSDKPIAYATLSNEENPALGVRGYRLATDKPELMEHQLDALKLAGERVGTTPWVMAPMIATSDEAAEFAALARARGLKPGVMVEVPSAALLADQILEHVDFVSIGTNDLTQYTMAADRMATDLVHLTDPWQPAVLHLVAATAAAGQRADKPVGVCGEAAADPMLACVLVGLGVTSLSMAAASVRAVGAQLGRVTLEQCREAAKAAMQTRDPHAARDAAREVLAGA